MPAPRTARLRIALVVPGGVGPDGVEAVIPALLSLVRRLAARHDVLVVAVDQAAVPSEYRLEGATVVALGTGVRGRAGWSGRPRRLGAMARAVARLRGFRPDVIHAFWIGRPSTVAATAASLLRVPLVVSIGGGELVALSRIRYGGARTFWGRLQARIALARADLVTGGSRAALAPVQPRRPDAELIPLGAERVVTDRRGEEGDGAFAGVAERPGRFRILVVGSVNRVKGPEVILGAIARARRALGAELSCDWIGEDTLDGRAVALARALGVDDVVTFHGFQPHSRVLARLAAVDVLVVGSHHEAQGVAVLEAAMASVPTVGTAVGIVADLAALEPPGSVVVPPGRPAELGEAVIELARDPSRRARLGAAARAFALRLDADATAAAFEAGYARVIRARAP